MNTAEVKLMSRMTIKKNVMNMPDLVKDMLTNYKK
jgi:hypothetical protein